MDDRAVNQNSEASGKFSILDWPTPEMLQAANHARAERCATWSSRSESGQKPLLRAIRSQDRLKTRSALRR